MHFCFLLFLLLIKNNEQHLLVLLSMKNNGCAIDVGNGTHGYNDMSDIGTSSAYSPKRYSLIPFNFIPSSFATLAVYASFLYRGDSNTGSKSSFGMIILLVS